MASKIVTTETVIPINKITNVEVKKEKLLSIDLVIKNGLFFLTFSYEEDFSPIYLTDIKQYILLEEGGLISNTLSFVKSFILDNNIIYLYKINDGFSYINLKSFKYERLFFVF